MKNLIISLLLICAVVTVHAQKTVASVNFSLTKEIGAGNLGSGAAFVKKILELSDNPNFDLQSIFDNFYTEFHENFVKEFPFELLDEAIVLGDESYQAYEPRFDGSKYYIVKDGYKPLQRPVLGIGKKDKEAMIEIYKDRSSAILMTYFYFEFVESTVMGIGSVKIRSFINMVCYNNEGKKVFGIIEFGTSKKGVPSIGGIPILKLEKILPMVQSSADDLLSDLKKDLGKIVRKSARKL